MSWERVLGHDDVRRHFLSAHQNGRFGQAFLFVGPEGVGKRLFARELTKALLCERPPAPLTACGHCPACAQVQAETHPDVFWLRTPEGKNELPVEEMREFCARMALKATRGRRKVGIVVDADDFNEESANSFLKTLEEPPPGSLSILLGSTTDRQLPTILSRCQVVRFSPLGPAHLRSILKENGVSDPVQVDRLVRLSGGSAGRALALNDAALWAFRESLIEGLTDPRPEFALLSESWQKFIEDAGKDKSEHRLRLSLTLRFLLETLRQALRLSLGSEGIEGDVKLRGFAAKLGTEKLLELIDRCVEADYRVERIVMPILVIESILDPFVRAAMSARAAR